jgi:hypothetical protein
MSAIQVYKGKYFLKWVKKPPEIVHYKLPEKVIVFDMDETLGCFADLYILWMGVKNLHPKFKQFDKMLDLYPEFLRPGIITILEYIYEKKLTKECSKVFIYTNNRCSKEWVQLITKYFQRKIHALKPKGDIHKTLFNKLICAFKINNQLVEACRTTNRKTYTDLVRCAMLSPDTEICFVDDVDHEEMKHSRVYYICPRPYYHNLTGHEIVQRFIEYKWFVAKKSPLLHSTTYWSKWFRMNKRGMHYQYRKNTLQQEIHVTKNIMHHIHEFFTWGNPPFYRSKKKVKTKKQAKHKQKHKKKQGGNTQKHRKPVTPPKFAKC